MPLHASYVRREGLTAPELMGHHRAQENTIERHDGFSEHGCASLTRKRSLVQTQYRPRTKKPLTRNGEGLRASLMRQALQNRGASMSTETERSASVELREAAVTLRQRAEAAVSPAPWSTNDTEVLDADKYTVVASEGSYPDHDLPYIATVHPGVGLALADWLDESAATVDTLARIGSAHPDEGASVNAHRLARLINGSA